MTHVEDIEVGDYIAIVSDRTSAQNMEGNFLVGQMCQNFDGRPLRVIAVCLPFLCLDSSQGSVDVRRFGVQKLTKEYVRAWKRSHDNKITFGAEARRKSRKKKQAPDGKFCPRCGGPMVERLILGKEGIVLGKSNSVWRIICTSCGHDDGPAKVRQQNP